MREQEQQRKWVYLVMLVAAVTVAFLSSKLIEFGIYNFNLQRKIRNVFLYGQLIAVGIGIFSYIVLINYEKVFKYIQEVVGETIKVSWPTKKEVIATTIVVIIGVLIAGIFLGVFDHIFALVMAWILKR